MKLFIIFLSLVLTANISIAADSDYPYETATVGTLKIDLSATTLINETAGCSFDKGKKEEWGADGLFHQNWKSNICGIEVDMASDTHNSVQRIASILLTPPSSLSTDKAIHIGSQEKAVLNAYKNFINQDESMPNELIVIGSIYGGISFSIKNHLVSSIFIGASAE